jgi:hypothetical protein
VSDVARTLDNPCQRSQVPMVVTAQFNRRAKAQQPSIADLHDCGQIEADADMITSLWQKPSDQAVCGMTKIYADVLKNRNGDALHNSGRANTRAGSTSPPASSMTSTSGTRDEVCEGSSVRNTHRDGTQR